MSSVYGLNFWQYHGYFADHMNRIEFGTADNDNASRGGHTNVEQEVTTTGGCPSADAGGSGQTIGQPWSYINWQSDIGNAYTRVWWGWFVPSYSGTLWLQTASDDSSLVYVSEDEFGQPTKSSNRTDVKTAAGGFSAITLVVNNGGTHGRTYRSGSMTVVANKSYFIRIYMGENSGGDNMIFSWNDTGDPADSTSNTMSYVKLDGSQSDKVLFYYNNPDQSKESSAPVDVSLGIVSWYDGASFDTANNKWIDKAGSFDISSDYITGTISKKMYLLDSILISNRNNKKYHQSKFPIYLSGSKNSGITFNKDASYQFLTDVSYTFFHVARRDPSDVNQTGRVFDGSGVDWYSGFNDASSGVAKHENDSINTIDKDYGTNWVVSVDTPKYYRSVSYSDTSNGYYETNSGIRNNTNTTSPQISVHYGSNTFQGPIGSGGIVTNYSNYCINTFLSSGTLSVSRNTTADFLIVGGGGGGGGQTHIGGGGGAGGVVIATNQSLAAGSYNVVVGNGGQGALIINPPAANGGLTNTYTDNNIQYNSFTFLSNGTFNVTSEGYFDFIIVGAGGSGGSHWGGGGGGGGVIIGTSQMLTTGSYTITVGTGAGQTGQNAQGADGNDSSIVGNNINLVAKGGGGGGWDTTNLRNGRNGGSGGGGADESCIGGSAIKSDGTVFTGGSVSLGDNITLYGNVGGSQSAAAGVYWPQRGMGGGGAGGPGEGVTQNGSPNHNKGPSGGIGIQNNFRTGSNVYYAGGGGGPAHTNYPQYVTVGGDGGLGGGGDGDWHGTNNGTAGAANTGGGGGGGSYQGTGESGGSGIVIIRYSTISQNNYALNGTDSSFNGFIAKGGGGGGTGDYIDSNLSEKGDGYAGGSGGGGGGNYLPPPPGTNTLSSNTDTVSYYTISSVNYQTHIFTTTGSHTLTVSSSVNVDFLLVGGGGGGGMDMGGGGGGGGVVIGNNYSLSAGNYTINVGVGGTGAPAANVNGQASGHEFTIGAQNGGDTTFAGFTAKGGGYGGSSYHGHQLAGLPNDGGCGGGPATYKDHTQTVSQMGVGFSTQDTYSNISGVTGYGQEGGNSQARIGTVWMGGGGGGAGQKGITDTDGNGGTLKPDGGYGIQNNFYDGTTNYYWGGGGGSSSHNTDYPGSGGLGGGGGGAGSAPGTTHNNNLGGTGGINNGQQGGFGGQNGGDGGANTGGGGGGGTTNNGGGNGGSGIVIIRFAYYPSTTPSYPGGNDGTQGGSSSQDTYSSIANVTGYGNSGGGFTGIPASEGDDAGGGGGGAGGGGGSRSSNGGGNSNGGLGIQNDFRTNTMIYYAGGGGGGSGTSSTPGTGGSSIGGSGSNSSSVPSSAVANSGSGGGGGNSSVNGGNGADGIVVVRLLDTPPAQQCDWNVAEVITYNRILDINEENKVFDYLKHRYLGTAQTTTGELYQLPGDISGAAMITGFPNEFPAVNNIIGWYVPESYDASGFWRDVSPYQNDLSSVGTSPEYVKNDSVFSSLSYLKGVKSDTENEIVASGYKFPEDFLPSDGSYTLIHVSRRISDSGRIFDSASNKNFYSGFVGNKTGVALHYIDVSSNN